VRGRAAMGLQDVEEDVGCVVVASGGAGW